MIQNKYSVIWRAFVPVALLLGIPSAFAAVILNENFNDVTGLPNANSTRTVAHILVNNPNQLPPGTSRSTTLPATDEAINVRRADNTINTTAGANGFDSFFTPANGMNKFLVLGDNSGMIGGLPVAGLSQVNFRFNVPADEHGILIKFDYAFDGTDPAPPPGVPDAMDRFTVSILDGFMNTLLSLPSPIFQSALNESRVFKPIQPGGYILRFQLEQVDVRNQPTITAAGIDNILVQTVPEPSTLALLGIGALGVLGWRRKQARAQRIPPCACVNSWDRGKPTNTLQVGVHAKPGER